MIKLTPRATKEILRLKNHSDNLSKPFLRIGVKNGGCSGYSYIFEFDTVRENDLLEEIEGLSIIIDPEEAKMIQNLEVDYESGLNNRGFIFHNPNAKTTCGCGTSFS